MTGKPLVVPTNLDTIESEINKFTINEEVVKTAYVNIHSDPIEPDTLIELGKYYTEDNTTYRITNFAYQAGSSKPAETGRIHKIR